MKKLFACVALSALCGAGCVSPEVPSSKTPLTEETVQPTSSTPVLGLAPLPSIVASKNGIDDSDWKMTVTKPPELAITYPVKGPYAVNWTHQLLKNDDVHLQGNCYVTQETKFQKTDVVGYAGNVCQTTTAIDAASGVRIDYFVLRMDNAIHLLTFTKKYSAGFDMNAYSEVLDYVLRIID